MLQWVDDLLKLVVLTQLVQCVWLPSFSRITRELQGAQAQDSRHQLSVRQLQIP